MKLTLKQAGLALGLSRTRLRELIANGRLRATKEQTPIGPAWFVHAGADGVPKIGPTTKQRGRPRKETAS